jgi:XTP/dITP diphosphohydrolase
MKKPLNNRETQLQAFNRLLDIMDELREKCPWDQKQTFDSLRHLTIEETYELGDAIIENDLQEIKKELGDLLLHIVFYAKIGSEKNAFDIADIANAISDKLVTRHPHIYGDVKVNSAEEVKQNWEQIKLNEGKKSVLEGVPASLPALVKALRIQDKAAGIGFDWDNKEQVWEKVQEELTELQHEVENGTEKSRESEFGDVLFALINYARFIHVFPENALENTNKKFIKRFQLMEKKITHDGKKMNEMNLTELDQYWNLTKKIFP